MWTTKIWCTTEHWCCSSLTSSNFGNSKWHAQTTIFICVRAFRRCFVTVVRTLPEFPPVRHVQQQHVTENRLVRAKRLFSQGNRTAGNFSGRLPAKDACYGRCFPVRIIINNHDLFVPPPSLSLSVSLSFSFSLLAFPCPSLAGLINLNVTSRIAPWITINDFVKMASIVRV